MKKTVLIILAFSTATVAMEMDYGRGTFSMKGGFLGLSGTISSDIQSYSLVERHSNIGDFFYGYDATWYDSEVMKQAQHTYNSMALPRIIPKMEHRLNGLDVNLKVGYDIVHENQDNFLGLGILLGLSIPVLESTSPENKSQAMVRKEVSDPVNDNELMVKSKTKMKTYKIGPTVNFQKALNKKISLYGIGSYAYQTGTIKNSYADADYSVDGVFQEYNVGLYFTPFTEQYKWGWITLSPRLYVTLGYKYANWDVDKMAINLSGSEMSSDVLEPLATKFSMDSSIGYFGVGYSF